MFNHIILVGRVGKKPELKSSSSGKNYCKMSVVTDSGYGENRTPNWHTVSAFGKTAENCCKYLDKGSLVLVSGSLQNHNYEKDGKKFHSVTVCADNIRFLSGGKNQPQQEQPQPDTSFDEDENPFEIPY